MAMENTMDLNHLFRIGYSGTAHPIDRRRKPVESHHPQDFSPGRVEMGDTGYAKDSQVVMAVVSGAGDREFTQD
jgi:hypothetical protein